MALKKHWMLVVIFCHSKSKTNPSDLDIASDDNPEKEITRKMMKLT